MGSRAGLLTAATLILGGWLDGAAAPTAAERGRNNLLTNAYNTPSWSLTAYENVWKRWGMAEKPADYARAFGDRYGLHPAPFDNGGLPMGLKHVPGLLGGKAITNDCLLCHGGSIFGRSYVGLGNQTLDMQSFWEELAASDGRPPKTPFPFSNVRGTTEAGAMAVYLFQIRDENLGLRKPVDLGLKADLCEDPPAWWLLKKKQTMYWTGSTPSRSVRSIMQFTLSPLHTLDYLKKIEPEFRDVLSYLLTIEAPKYPLPVDAALVDRGEKLFRRDCARCHGTYGAEGTYPNKIIPLDELGTDPTRARGISKAVEELYLKTWFGQETGPDGKRLELRPVGEARKGYQAPPLDGIWATAPYFHNGSAPTVYHVLNSQTRPRYFTRSYRTGVEDYDPERLGWKITELPGPADPSLSGLERRKVYDTTQPGRGNGGHTFGDHLTDDERRAVIEYLKTL